MMIYAKFKYMEDLAFWSSSFAVKLQVDLFLRWAGVYVVFDYVGSNQTWNLWRDTNAGHAIFMINMYALHFFSCHSMVAAT